MERLKRSWEVKLILTLAAGLFFGAFSLPVNNPVLADGETTKGIDFGSGREIIDGSKLLENEFRFLFVKATEGFPEDEEQEEDLQNPNLKQNMQDATEAGLLAGAFHFARPDYNPSLDGAVKEAEWFLEVARPFLKEGFLRPVLDIEKLIGGVKDRKIIKERLSRWIHKWMNTVKRELGVEPILYVNRDYAQNYLDDSIAQYDLWISAPTSGDAYETKVECDTSIPPDIGIWEDVWRRSWSFWQYAIPLECTNDTVPGIDGTVDFDVFNGTFTELEDLFKINYTINNPPSGFPLDIYLLIDLSGSFSDDLPIFQAQAPAIISFLKWINPNTRFGLGKFEDYPISPFGTEDCGDKAYARVTNLTFNTNILLKTIDELFTRCGADWKQSHLAALYQAATGKGQDVNKDGDFIDAEDIFPGQQVNFRDDAVKIIIVWTDAPFHTPEDEGYPGPSWKKTEDALLAGGIIALKSTRSSQSFLATASPERPIKVIGISSGTAAIPDLKRIVEATGNLAPPDGIDCDGDGVIDIPAGEPIVCGIGPSGEGIAEAVIATVEAVAKFEYSNLEVTPTTVLPGQTVQVRATVRNVGTLAGTEIVDLMVDGVVRDSQEVTLVSGESREVEFTFSFREDEVGTHQVTINGLAPITVAVVTEGDINADGSIDATDVRWLVEAIMGLRELTPEQRERADVAPPSGLDSTDTRYIVEFIQGIRSTLTTLGTSTEAQARSLTQKVQRAEIKIESKEEILPGETATLQLSISGLSDPGLADLQIGPQGAIRFDPKVIQVKSVKGIGPFQVMHPLLIDNENGGVRFIAVASSKKFVKEGPIIELAVTAVGREGESSPIEITGLDVLRDGEIGDIKSTIVNGRVTLGEAQELQVNSVLNIPNPVTGRSVEFRVEGLGIKTVQVEIYDLSGQRIFNSGEVFGQTLQWNLQNDSGNIVANGVYLYIVTVRGFNGEVYRSSVKKLVVLR